MISIKMTGLKETLSVFDDIADQINKIPEGLQEEVTVKDSQFTNMDNKVDTERLSQAPEDAKNEARYVATRLNQSFDESGTTSEEMQKAEEEIIERYIRDYVETIIK